MDAKRRYVDRLIDFERRAYRIYARWAANENLPHDVRELWRAMAEEEKQHLAILERSAGLLNFAAAPPPESPQKLENIAAQIETVERMMIEPETALDTLLDYALALETSELNQLGDTWLKSFQPDIANLTPLWIPAYEHHIQRLASAVHRYSTDENLHKKAAALSSQLEGQKDASPE